MNIISLSTWRFHRVKTPHQKRDFGVSKFGSDAAGGNGSFRVPRHVDVCVCPGAGLQGGVRPLCRLLEPHQPTVSVMRNRQGACTLGYRSPTSYGTSCTGLLHRWDGLLCSARWPKCWWFFCCNCGVWLVCRGLRCWPWSMDQWVEMAGSLCISYYLMHVPCKPLETVRTMHNINLRISSAFHKCAVYTVWGDK